MTEGKVCTKCGVWKGLEAFPSDRQLPNQKSQCKACKAERNRERRANSPHEREREAERAAKYWSANREKRREISRRYDQKNRAKKRQYYEQNKCNLIAKGRARQAAFSHEQREKLRAIQAQSSRNARRVLRDSYIKSLLAEGGVYVPSPELINLKREHLRLQRLVKELQQAQPKEPK